MNCPFSGVIEYYCPKCGKTFQAGIGSSSGSVECPTCTSECAPISRPPPIPVQPPPLPATKEQLSGFGGWLIIPAIGVALPVVIGLPLSIIFAAVMIVTDATAMKNLILPEFFKLPTIFGTILLCYSCVLFLVFFKRKKAAIHLFIFGLFANELYLILVEFSQPEQDLITITVGVLWAFIWSAYFLRSKRVKATFVN